MKNFRDSNSSSCEWLDVRKENGFSNFRFVDDRFRSCPTLRRILSLARKHGFKSMLVEEIRENECGLLEQENQALAVRCPESPGLRTALQPLMRTNPEKMGLTAR